MSRKVKVLVCSLVALALLAAITLWSLQQNAPTAEQLAETTLGIDDGLNVIDDNKVNYYLPHIDDDYTCFYLFEREVNLWGKAELRFTLYKEENWGEYAPGVDWSEPPTIRGFTLKALDEFMEKYVPGLVKACDLSLV